MNDYPLADGRYLYRPLKRGCRGWDVFGVQKLLIAADFDLPKFGADGDFGAETEDAVKRYQRSKGLAVDGIAGIATQADLCKRVIVFRCGVLCTGHARGQIEAESSFWCGNHTQPYENGSRDLGLTMKHMEPSYANKLHAFDGPRCLAEFGDFMRLRFKAYRPKVSSNKRAWQLAAGAWNAPAWTDKLANGGTLKPSQQEHLDAYIARATVYITNWDTVPA